MTRVKLQKHRGSHGRYVHYLISIPKAIVETLFSNVKEFDLKIEKGKIILKPVKKK